MQTRIQRLENESSTDKIFYNLSVSNETTGMQTLFFNDTLDRFILPGRPRDWEVSIVRFRIPMLDVPIFYYKKGDEILTMSYKTPLGVLYEASMDIPYYNLNFSQAYFLTTGRIYQISQYMIMLNKGVQYACDMLDAVFYAATTTHLPIVTATAANPAYDPLLPITIDNLEFIQTYNKPYFVYDKLTYKISIYADRVYYENTLETATPATDYFYLSCNRACFSRIEGIDILARGRTFLNKEFTFIFQDNLNNISVGGIIQNLQQADSFGYMTDFVSLRIVSDLPSQLEYDKTGTGQAILADFIPLDVNINTFHADLIYNAVVPYRQSQILTEQPFNNIMLRVFSVIHTGQVLPLGIAPGLTAVVKLMFQLRSSARY